MNRVYIAICFLVVFTGYAKGQIEDTLQIENRDASSDFSILKKIEPGLIIIGEETKVADMIGPYEVTYILNDYTARMKSEIVLSGKYKYLHDEGSLEPDHVFFVPSRSNLKLLPAFKSMVGLDFYIYLWLRTEEDKKLFSKSGQSGEISFIVEKLVLDKAGKDQVIYEITVKSIKSITIE